MPSARCTSRASPAATALVITADSRFIPRWARGTASRSCSSDRSAGSKSSGSSSASCCSTDSHDDIADPPPLIPSDRTYERRIDRRYDRNRRSAGLWKRKVVHMRVPRPAATSGRQVHMDRSTDEVVRRVLDQHARTFADEAGISLTDEPAPLFQLLVLAQLLSARIGAAIAIAAAREVTAAGWTTAQKLRDASRPRVVAPPGRAGYRRYDERTATQLREMASLVLDRYGGDLRRLADAAGGEIGAASRLIQEVNGIGPTGAAVFLREVQLVWPWVRPYLDDRARAGAGRIGLPDDERLVGLVEPDELAR